MFLLMDAIFSGDVDGMSAPGASPPVVKSLENAFTNAASAVLPGPTGTPPPAESLPPQTAPVGEEKAETTPTVPGPTAATPAETVPGSTPAPAEKPPAETVPGPTAAMATPAETVPGSAPTPAETAPAETVPGPKAPTAATPASTPSARLHAVLRANKEKHKDMNDTLRQALLALGPPGSMPKEEFLNELANLHSQVFQSEVKEPPHNPEKESSGPVLLSPPAAKSMPPPPEKKPDQPLRLAPPAALTAPNMTPQQIEPVPVTTMAAAKPTPPETAVHSTEALATHGTDAERTSPDDVATKPPVAPPERENTLPEPSAGEDTSGALVQQLAELRTALFFSCMTCPIRYMHACGFMLKSYCFRLGKKPGTYDKVDHQSLGHHMEKNKSIHTHTYSSSHTCVLIYMC